MLYLLLVVIAFFVIATYVAICSGKVRTFEPFATAPPVSAHFSSKAGDIRRRKQIARGILRVS